MPPIVKQYDTWPPWLFALNDDTGPIDLSSADSVKLYMKQVSGTTSLGPLEASITAESTITANTAVGDPNLTGISSMAALVEGSTLVGPNIPDNTIITQINPAANSAVMSNPALQAGTGVTITINRGMVSYTPVVADTTNSGLFNVEAAIHWDAGGTKITKVPNSQAANPQLQIDPDLTSAVE